MARRPVAVALVACLATFPAPHLALAQDGSGEFQLHHLTDADVEALMPVVRGRLAAYETFRDEFSDAEERTLERGMRWRSGESPLPYLRSLAPEPAVPDGATYVADCSEAITRLVEEPFAVFTFGIEASESDLVAYGVREMYPDYPRQAETTPRAPLIEAVARRADAFYRDRGWIPGDPAGSPGVYASPDGRVTALFARWNVAVRWTMHGPYADPTPEQARAHEVCVAMGWGPSLILEERGGGVEEFPVWTGGELSDDLAGALFALLSAAREWEQGAADPAALAESLAEAEAVGGWWLAMERTRQANLRLYGNHAPRIHELVLRLDRMEGG